MYSLSAGERVVGAARVGLAVGERDNSFRTHRWQKALSHFGLTSALPILPLNGGGAVHLCQFSVPHPLSNLDSGSSTEREHSCNPTRPESFQISTHRGAQRSSGEPEGQN